MRMIAVFAAVVVGFTTACTDRDNDRGPSVESSVEVDLDRTKDSLEKTVSSAEREIKEGSRKVKDELEDAGEALKEEFKAARDKINGAESEVEVKINRD